MGGTKSFLKILKNGISNGLGIELDPIRSEYPIQSMTGGGLLLMTAGAAGSFNSFSFQVPSGKVFHLNNLILNNGQEAGPAVIYDGPGTSHPMFWYPVQQSTGEVLAGLKGLVFQSIPMLSFNGSQLYGRLGGTLRDA